MRELMLHREATVRKLMKQEEEQLKQLAAANKDLEDKRVELVCQEQEEGTLRAELAATGAREQQLAARRHLTSPSRVQR